MDCEPLVALPPDQLPDALQELALVDDQVKVDPLALVTVLGLALIALASASRPNL